MVRAVLQMSREQGRQKTKEGDGSDGQ
jgi:hypothetical protein